jgi:large subunit ribosomal protein L4
MSSEVLNTKLFDAKGKEKGVIALSPAVFATPIKSELIHTAVRWQRAKKRAGTHDVLTRSEMKGGKKKPFKQKGTGNARAGSSVSPLMVGGAVVHGPAPRSYEFRFSKKMKKAALTSAFAVKVAQDAVLVVEGMNGTTGKTREASALLKSLGITGQKTVVIVPNEPTAERNAFVLSFRNIPGVTVTPVTGVNVYDLINCKKVLCVSAALAELEARVGQAAK